MVINYSIYKPSHNKSLRQQIHKWLILNLKNAQLNLLLLAKTPLSHFFHCTCCCSQKFSWALQKASFHKFLSQSWNLTCGRMFCHHFINSVPVRYIFFPFFLSLFSFFLQEFTRFILNLFYLNSGWPFSRRNWTGR